MKLRIFATTIAAMTLLLAACGNQNNQDTSKDNEKKVSEKKDNKQTENTKDTNKDDTQSTDQKTTKSTEKQEAKSEDKKEDKKQDSGNVEQKVAALSNNQKVALGLFSSQTITASAQELLNHSYTSKGNGGQTQKAIQTLQLKQMPPNAVTNAPQGMVFYSANAAKGSYGTVIGISNSEICICGTQYGPIPYQELIKIGNVYQLNALYQQFGKDPKLNEVANLISVN